MAENSNRIAIIGGGMSGLAVAYQLITREPRIENLEIVIYERSQTLGGNADTVKVSLGRDFADPAYPEFPRPADLGVNDFNAASYKRMVAAMNNIGFVGRDKYRPLEDTVCFFTRDGSVLYTVDHFYKEERHSPRIVDDRFNLHQRNPKLAELNDEFMSTAANDVDKNRADVEHMTVADYVEYFANHPGRESTPDPQLLKEMAEHLLYPRISAMYFVDEQGPESMPIIAVMEYYILQEGYGEPDTKPERMYFVDGSQEWINFLHNWLRGEGREPADEKRPKVETVYGFSARVVVDGDGAHVYSVGERGSEGLPQPERFDKVVFACHADDALRSFGPNGLTDKIAMMLGRVSYTNSIAICHTFTGVLPPHRDSWRTYNVMIRKGTAMTPYSMTYVINRHQNDYGQDSEYKALGLPQFFVTLNPAVRIPDEYVLRMDPDYAAARAARAPGYLKMSSGATENMSDRYTDKAIGWFRHNVLDFACLEAQAMVQEVQGEFGRLYFAGGWTNGAGLHEQCWEQSELVVEAMNLH